MFSFNMLSSTQDVLSWESVRSHHCLHIAASGLVSLSSYWRFWVLISSGEVVDMGVSISSRAFLMLRIMVLRVICFASFWTSVLDFIWPRLFFNCPFRFVSRIFWHIFSYRSRAMFLRAITRARSFLKAIISRVATMSRMSRSFLLGVLRSKPRKLVLVLLACNIWLSLVSR